ncbi:hypothetical protein SODALDRAFT_75523 [Sodiomyces alkalinus F11]|uniref:Uncharacterized protein n=1 Tax=Sodiomyces alkalinus (strain CBS 110278 / VKM F-3762 / F11) TaxID=1314773 RepID=A0A3N2PKB5_SODAK|nr:hypothetical protein SODALDRAFT_75523 [Sodiomyces alkalinus F11]ROT34982.1 hypothetical protein SODALDRAFT_75523 [Sodiomyces alkalinus F11]
MTPSLCLDVHIVEGRKTVNEVLFRLGLVSFSFQKIPVFADDDLFAVSCSPVGRFLWHVLGRLTDVVVLCERDCDLYHSNSMLNALDRNRLVYHFFFLFFLFFCLLPPPPFNSNQEMSQLPASYTDDSRPSPPSLPDIRESGSRGFSKCLSN